MPSRHSGNLPQVLPLAKQNRVSTFSDRCVCTSAFLCGKSSSDDFSPRLLLRKQKRSQPLLSKPHIMRQNRLLTISVWGCYCVSKNVLSHCVASRISMRRNRLLTISGWGCYNTILVCRQGTAAICRKFCLWQNKIVFQRSRTGAYAPPHFYAVNHRQMILVRGCYCVSKNVLSHCLASRILCGKIVFWRFQSEVVIA